MDSKMQKVANIIGYLIGGILVSLVGVAIIASLDLSLHKNKKIEPLNSQEAEAGESPKPGRRRLQ